MFGPGCGTRRGAEFSRFLPLATDEGESQTVGGPCVPHVGNSPHLLPAGRKDLYADCEYSANRPITKFPNPASGTVCYTTPDLAFGSYGFRCPARKPRGIWLVVAHVGGLCSPADLGLRSRRTFHSFQ